MRTFGLISLVGCLGFLIGRADLARVQSQATHVTTDRNSGPRRIKVDCASEIGDFESPLGNASESTVELVGSEEVETANTPDLDAPRDLDHLYGNGLVIGLNGTGGQSLSTEVMALEYLKKINIAAQRDHLSDEDSRLLSNNFCQVIVTAKLLRSAKNESRIEATVSVLDDAMSLKGGTLLFTELKGADGTVYATAEGPVSPYVRDGNWLSHPTVARLKNAAVVTHDPVIHDLDETAGNN